MRHPHPDAARLTWWAIAAALGAALAAGPWPGLPPVSLLWRVPLSAAGLAVAWSRLSWRGAVAAAVLALAFAQDALLPAEVDPHRVAAQAGERVRAVQQELGALAEQAELRHWLSAGGGEAEPEQPFRLLDRLAGPLRSRSDCLVLVDERGQPVAWIGARPALPVRLRPLGERTVVAEPEVSGVRVWWREPVFETGRPVGSLLAGVALPEEGERRLMGAWAGRAAVATALLEGGEGVANPGGGRLLGVAVRATAPVVWASPAMAAIVVAGLLGTAGNRRREVLLLGLAGLGVLALPAVGREWWLVGGELLLAAGLVSLPSGRTGWAVSVAVLGVAAWLLPGLLGELEVQPVPDNLLWPGVLRWGVILGGVVALRATRPTPWAVPWPLRLAAWLPLAVGTVRADPWWLGAGIAAVVAVGSPARRTGAAGLAFAALLAGAQDAEQARALVASTESTLARLDREAGPARALLASLPGTALDDLVQLPPGEGLVIIGRLAHWLDLGDALPGAALVLLDAGDVPQASWGETAVPGDASQQTLAERPLEKGWKLAILTPPPPHDVLSALLAGGVATPVAAYDRAGAAISRGGTFRPLSPTRVGRALAERRGWGHVVVGERRFAAYLRARGNQVLALPWVRRPSPEQGLVVIGMALWGALPLGAWEQRRRLRERWVQRNTFAGRVQALLLAATVVPLLLLAQLLPQQWVRQRDRARLEVARAVSWPIAVSGWEHELGWIVRDLGGTVAVYRSGAIVWCTRPDLALVGEVPQMPPEEAYVRAVRGWQEPLVVGRSTTDVYTPLEGGQEPTVVAVFGLQVAGVGSTPSPLEWFAVMGTLAALLALAAAERLGRRLAGPLGRLVTAARRLERGEPLPELGSAADEDVAALSHAFVAMAQTVRGREEELRGERDLLERVLGTLSAAVAVAGHDGAVTLANAAARRLLGGKGSVASLLARFGPEVGALVEAAAAGKAGETTVHPVSAPEELWRVTVQPLSGAPGRTLVVMEDLSEVARAQRLASLAEAARIVAHEVKNPLTPIRLWAEELQSAIERGAGDTVQVARVAAEQILERVEHLREVAQGFSNLVALERWDPEVVSLADTAREVIAEYAVLAQRGVSVELLVEHDAAVLIDLTWLRRALRNLLENSVRALAGKRGRVEVSVCGGEREATLTVRDTGGGVPDAHLGRLFEPHFSTTSEGSGLGLAVVQRVVARAGGRVEARNADGGLEVQLVFPPSPNGGDRAQHEA